MKYIEMVNALRVKRDEKYEELATAWQEFDGFENLKFHHTENIDKIRFVSLNHKTEDESVIGQSVFQSYCDKGYYYLYEWVKGKFESTCNFTCLEDLMVHLAEKISYLPNREKNETIENFEVSQKRAIEEEKIRVFYDLAKSLEGLKYKNERIRLQVMLDGFNRKNISLNPWRRDGRLTSNFFNVYYNNNYNNSYTLTENNSLVGSFQNPKQIISLIISKIVSG